MIKKKQETQKTELYLEIVERNEILEILETNEILERNEIEKTI